MEQNDKLEVGRQKTATGRRPSYAAGLLPPAHAQGLGLGRLHSVSC